MTKNYGVKVCLTYNLLALSGWLVKIRYSTITLFFTNQY